MSTKYLPSDWRSLELHKAVANKIEQDPSLVQVAIQNIGRWKHQNDFPQPHLDQWLIQIGHGLEPLVSLLRSETDEAARLRSSSPFVGILSEQERDEIFHRFASDDQ